MPDFVKSLDNIADDFVSIYLPQTVYAETGEDRYRLHPGLTADELRCCESSSPAEPDTTAPTLTGRDPLPDTTGIALDHEIIMDFDEAVTLVDGFTISIRRQSDDQSIKDFTLQSNDVLYENSNSRIRLRNIPFAPSTFYYVLVPAGAIADLAGNDFPGYGVNAWAFQTAAS